MKANQNSAWKYETEMLIYFHVKIEPNTDLQL